MFEKHEISFNFYNISYSIMKDRYECDVFALHPSLPITYEPVDCPSWNLEWRLKCPLGPT
jgi:hypothetical protein